MLRYYAPSTLEEALDHLSRLGPEATVLAGGQDIVPLMNQGKLWPANVIDLKALKGMVRIETNGSLVIGALATHRSIERSEDTRKGCGLLAEAASQIGGGMQVRNRGTIGGAVCAASPVYDILPCLVAAGAELRLVSSAGQRDVPAAKFFCDAGKTVLRPDELLTEISVPKLNPGAGFAYHKLKFSDGCYSIASAACVLELNPDESCRTVRLVLGAVAPVPAPVRELEAMADARLTGKLLSDVAAAAERAAADPITDVQADAAYRRAMAGVMARRAVASAFERAREKRKGQGHGQRPGRSNAESQNRA